LKTKVLEIHPEYPDTNHISMCAKIIRQGGLVIFPTETVYGIAVDNSNPQAIARLREVKKRSEGKPFSILVSQKGLMFNYTNVSNPLIYKLIDKFWPGPLTIIVPSHKEGETIGVRMPDNKIALKLLDEAQCTIAAPSANFEGSPPPVTCQEALKELDGLVDIAIDGGNAKLGNGSTVVDLSKEGVQVLREGNIKKEDIQKVQKTKTVLFVCTGNSCRSVMAEYLFKSMMAGRDDVESISAGTSVFIHAKASNETISVLGKEGIDATKHLSQSVTRVLLKKSDLIVVMTRAHRSAVLERAPDIEKRVYLLKEFANTPASFQTELDIPDPIGQSHVAYQDCMSVIKESIVKLKDLI
jgi:L-threonylcarbamoyladenylate synthase